MKKSVLSFLCIVIFSGSAHAGLIEFVPPNDTSGMVYSMNANDGWSGGRGVVFQVTDDVTIDSVGVFQDLSNINLEFELAQVFSASGAVTSGQTVLASGSASTTTSGLEWIDFSIADLLLEAGNFYHLEFTFTGSSNQNFFYNNSNVAFTQGNYNLVEGTSRGNTSNFVMGAFRLNEAEADVPEPSSLILLLLGMGGLFFSNRKAVQL